MPGNTDDNAITYEPAGELIEQLAPGRGKRWFHLPRGEAHREAWRMGMNMKDAAGEDREQTADDCLSLYFGNTRNSVRGNNFGLSYFDEGPPGYNVVQACVDTKVAHTVRNKVRVMFLTDRGNPTERDMARGMQRAVEAVFDESGIWGPQGVDWCFHGNLFEGGIFKIVPDYANERVLADLVFPWELFVPQLEARTGKPTQIAHIFPVDRDKALDFFKDSGEAVLKAIAEAQPASFHDIALDESNDPGQLTDQILLCEMHHLPSGRVDLSSPGAWGYDERGDEVPVTHDGRRVICTEQATLLDEPWPYDRFPYAKFLPMKKPTSFWSRSLPETLAGAQLALNRMNQRIDGIMHMHARPLLIAWARAKLNTDKITNAYATIMESQVPPEQALKYLTPQSVPAEYIARVDKIIAWAEKQAGLSELSIAAQKPPGIEHAPALQHLEDEQSVRHTPSFKAWEEAHVEAAKLVVDCLRLLAQNAKRNKRKLTLIWGNDRDLKKIEWDKVDLPADRYKIKAYPTNFLPRTPAARMTRIIEMLKSGMFTPQQCALALGEDFPDIEAITGDVSAAQRNIEQKLEKLIQKGESEETIPHAYINLALAKQMASDRLNALEADGGDDQAITDLAQFWEDCHALELKKMAEEAAAMQGMAPPAALGPAVAPGAPPVGPVPPGAPPVAA